MDEDGELCPLFAGCGTYSVLWNEALVPHGCVHAAGGMKPSFRELYFCHLWKRSQTETGFKTNFLPMKGENSITSFCVVLTFKWAKIWCLVKEILVFCRIWSILFMDDVSEHKIDDFGICASPWQTSICEEKPSLFLFYVPCRVVDSTLTILTSSSWMPEIACRLLEILQQLCNKLFLL